MIKRSQQILIFWDRRSTLQFGSTITVRHDFELIQVEEMTTQIQWSKRQIQWSKSRRNLLNLWTKNCWEINWKGRLVFSQQTYEKVHINYQHIDLHYTCNRSISNSREKFKWPLVSNCWWQASSDWLAGRRRWLLCSWTWSPSAGQQARRRWGLPAAAGDSLHIRSLKPSIGRPEGFAGRRRQLPVQPNSETPPLATRGEISSISIGSCWTQQAHLNPQRKITLLPLIKILCFYNQRLRIISAGGT